jgi:hypothetical protein
MDPASIEAAVAAVGVTAAMLATGSLMIGLNAIKMGFRKVFAMLR